MYRVKLKNKPKCENTPMILDSEWKTLIKDSKEKKMRKEGKMPPGLARYIII